MAATPSTCANCNEKIGALEKAFVFDAHNVCRACNEKLTGSAGSAGAPAAIAQLKPGEIQCPFCHKPVVPAKKAKGDMVTAIILLICGVIPGAIYMITHSGFILACPQCKTKIADA
jgi:hypothetical protein